MQMVQDKFVQARRWKEPQRTAAADSNADWADSDAPDAKVIYAQLLSAMLRVRGRLTWKITEAENGT
ncbi:MAG: hypothetical protein IJ899_01405 [Blautia sp.]|nr:hypothetical protein [Blautia sp.]